MRRFATETNKGKTSSPFNFHALDYQKKSVNTEIKKARETLTIMPKTEQFLIKPSSHDIAVQGTNNSSIASKRSVEALYYPKLHFNRCVDKTGTTANGSNGTTREYFKYFVPRLRKRSPCINRGYWLRLYAIRSTLESILASTGGDGQVLVINLGCGFDPLPFQLLDTKNADSLQFCHRLSFLDLDYAEVIRNKCKVIQTHSELMEILQTDCVSSNDRIQTAKYSAIPCNLNDSESFEAILKCPQVSPLLLDREVPKVFIAEVSLAYMEPQRADTIIRISSNVPNSHMVLLEQLIPAGCLEPFARQMLLHFTKNGSPLQSVLKYRTKDTQAERLKTLGFSNVNCGDLLQVWDSIDTKTRHAVESIEPFDELEESQLFAHHYVLAHGTNNPSFQFMNCYSTISEDHSPGDSDSTDDLSKMVTSKEPIIGTVSFEKVNLDFTRNFGASIFYKTQDHQTLIYTSGCNPNRVNTTTLIELDPLGENVIDCTEINVDTNNEMKKPQGPTHSPLPSPRVCATFTLLHDTDTNNPTAMLIGGRGPPHRSFNDTWFFECKQHRWSQGPVLPGGGRFRHCTVTLKNGHLLIFGGFQRVSSNESIESKSESESEPEFLLFNSHDNAFTTCKYDRPVYNGLVGACMAYDTRRDIGVIIGGQDENGQVCDRLTKFTCDPTTGRITVLEEWEHPLFQRYGAKCLFVNDDVDSSFILIAGGTSPGMVFDEKTSFVLVDLEKRTLSGIQIPAEFYRNHSIFLVGFELQRVSQNVVYVIGGGATCYGFGAVSNHTFKLDLTGLLTSVTRR